MTTGIGALVDHVDLSLTDIYERTDIAAKLGVDGVWLTQLPSQREAGALLAGIAARTERVTLGSAVLPVYNAPPVIMAQTAMTLDEVCGQRLVLGLGRGHRMFGEWMFGGRYPASPGAMREYLTIVTALIRHGEVNFDGRWYRGKAIYAAARRADLPVHVGAFGPRTLEVAAEVADGVILWLCTPSYVRDVVMPSLQAGWARRPGGRGAFSVTVIVPALVSDRPAEDLSRIRGRLNGYLQMENYRKLLAAAGLGGASRVTDTALEQLAVCGSPARIQDRISAYREAGVSDVVVSPVVAAGDDTPRFAATLETAIGG